MAWIDIEGIVKIGDNLLYKPKLWFIDFRVLRIVSQPSGFRFGSV